MYENRQKLTIMDILLMIETNYIPVVCSSTHNTIANTACTVKNGENIQLMYKTKVFLLYFCIFSNV